MPFIAIALVIAAALGGGTAAAAQASLPGDALWGFKVHINEGVAGALSSSDQARADWDLTTIKTRLGEAQKLSAKGRLSADVQAEIAANLKLHADSLTNTVAKLQSQGASRDAATIAARYQAELATAADTNLKTYADADSSVSTDGAVTLGSTVQAALEEASTLSASVSAAIH